ncbi:MAG: AAA family ATPase [Oscillospiraceae bacterium]|nr:AAA family ATPase [Oscillospiraceae bacterium]
MQKRFHTIDGETLMNQPLEPIQFVVEGLLSNGLHLLAGAPKSGKSWLALWLSVIIAKGEDVWGNAVKQGTTLYLCFEDSRLRIQNRLFDITDDAPSNVHFSEENYRLGEGLEERITQFVFEHPDTVLIIIDTLQMIRRPAPDNSYANDYADLSALKKLADKNQIAILLIHHLRKQKDDDPFNRISGTTGLSGAVDTSFTLVEEKRGSGKATLSCIGRDIEYREIELERNENNVWELVSDSKDNPDLLLPDIVLFISDFMNDRKEYQGSPTELAGLIGRKEKMISHRTLSRLLLQNQDLLYQKGLTVRCHRSNGSRLISLTRLSDDSAESDDEIDNRPRVKNIGPVDPVGTS